MKVRMDLFARSRAVMTAENCRAKRKFSELRTQADGRVRELLTGQPVLGQRDSRQY